VATARKVVYIDFRDVNYNNGSVTVCAAIAAGYNVINLAFWLLSGPADMALVWFQLPAATQISTQQYARSMGASLVVAAGGATDLPYAQISGQAYGTAVARFALANHLDGVDFDMENFGPGLTASGLSSAACIQWLIDATIAARTVLGPNAIISHAPQAPYFGKIGSALQNPWTLTSGGYSAVYAGAGSSISFFNIQFYNQGPTCYVTYTGLFKMSLDNGVGCTAFPGTSVSEIFSYGIPLYKIVVGKFNLPSDASTGFVSAPTLGQWFTTANQELGYNSGVMVWSYQQSTSAMWIKAAWPNAPALPITGVPTVGPTAAPPTSAPTSAPQPTVPSLPTAVPTTAPTAAPVTQAPTSTPSAGPTNVPITAAPTSAPTPVVTMAPTVAPIQPTLIPAGTANGMCNATDPSFVCTSGCALFQCIPNQGIRVVIPCPGGTACMNGACGFGQCINGISVMRNTDATGTAATPTTAAAAPDFQWAWIAVPVAAASLILIVLIARRCGCCLGVQKSEPSTGGVAHGRRIQRASQELATSVVAPVSSSVPPSTLPGIKTNEIKPIAGLHRRDGSAGLHDISLQLCSPTRATHARRRSRVDIV
jgi:chitinase